MKRNLKNRPKITVTFESEPYEFSMQVQKLEVYLDSMERELREAYENPKLLTGSGLLIPKKKASQGDLQYAEGWRQATFRAIRTILGEAEAT